MLLSLSLVLLVSTFTISTLLMRHFWTRPGAMMDRIAERWGAARAVELASRMTIIKVAHLAGWLDKSGGKQKLHRDFMCAGLGYSRFEPVFPGLRVIAAAAGGALFMAAALLARAATPVIIMSAIGGAMGGFALPGQLLICRIQQRRRKIEKTLPNALDLLTISVEAGLGLDQALQHVSRELKSACSDISEEFAIVNLEIRAGKKRAEALRSLAERTRVPDLKKLTVVLIQADRFGTSIAQTLRAHSEYLRGQARQRAEEKAAKLGVKLVFPIFFFILPSLFVIAVGPVIVRIFSELVPMMNSM